MGVQIAGEIRRARKTTKPMPTHGYVTHLKAAALLLTNRETIWRWVQAKKLRGRQKSGVQVVSLRNLRRFARRNGFQVPD